MRICAISDTHSKHNSLQIPEADVLVCAGDITYRGEMPIISSFAEWLKDLPIKHKVVIFGNHEVGMRFGSKRMMALEAMKWAGAHYLEDSGVEIDGVNFWGSPAQPWFCDWEWNYQRGKDIAAVWAKIPENTNVLITHGPVLGILDEVPDGSHVGCQDLSNRIAQLPNLKAHVCGHIHHSYGTRKFLDVQYVNAASCDEQYRPTNEPIIFEI